MHKSECQGHGVTIRKRIDKYRVKAYVDPSLTIESIINKNAMTETLEKVDAFRAGNMPSKEFKADSPSLKPFLKRQCRVY